MTKVLQCLKSFSKFGLVLYKTFIQEENTSIKEQGPDNG